MKARTYTNIFRDGLFSWEALSGTEHAVQIMPGLWWSESDADPSDLEYYGVDCIVVIAVHLLKNWLRLNRAHAVWVVFNGDGEQHGRFKRGILDCLAEAVQSNNKVFIPETTYRGRNYGYFSMHFAMTCSESRIERIMSPGIESGTAIIVLCDSMESRWTELAERIVEVESSVGLPGRAPFDKAAAIIDCENYGEDLTIYGRDQDVIDRLIN